SITGINGIIDAIHVLAEDRDTWLTQSLDINQIRPATVDDIENEVVLVQNGAGQDRMRTAAKCPVGSNTHVGVGVIQKFAKRFAGAVGIHGKTQFINGGHAEFAVGIHGEMNEFFGSGAIAKTGSGPRRVITYVGRGMSI